MRIPRKFKVRGNTWRVEYCADLVDEYDKKCDGILEHDKRLLYIEKSLNSHQRQLAYLHEWVHCVLYEHKLGVTSLTPDVEEIICEAFAEELKKIL